VYIFVAYVALPNSGAECIVAWLRPATGKSIWDD
jgi:hypothetical protein